MSLPMFPEITEAQQRRAVDVIRQYKRQALRTAA
jgi:hypothetical protein